MNKQLLKFMQKPQLYEPSSNKFWNDEHISKGMLEAHLNKEWEAATRKYDFVINSVEWISSIAPPSQKNKLLDLGCGPGIYAELFNQKGYDVTGVDFSERSINYALESAKKENLDITYICQDYLELDLEEKFDLITLIYCDFGVLSDINRQLLLKKIYSMLKHDGVLILDVFTPFEHEGKQEYKRWNYFSNGGFWCEKPYGCLEAFYKYESNTILNQSIVLTDDEVKCYNIWEHMFTCDELLSELKAAGNWNVEFYSNIMGEKYINNSKTLCVVARKEM